MMQIFWPVEPKFVGPFRIQGLFLTRQNAVAAEFALFLRQKVCVCVCHCVNAPLACSAPLVCSLCVYQVCPLSSAYVCLCKLHMCVSMYTYT